MRRSSVKVGAPVMAVQLRRDDAEPVDGNRLVIVIGFPYDHTDRRYGRVPRGRARRKLRPGGELPARLPARRQRSHGPPGARGRGHALPPHDPGGDADAGGRRLSALRRAHHRPPRRRRRRRCVQSKTRPVCGWPSTRPSRTASCPWSCARSRRSTAASRSVTPTRTRSLPRSSTARATPASSSPRPGRASCASWPFRPIRSSPSSRRHTRWPEGAHPDDLAGHRVAFNRFGPGADEFVERLRKAGMPEWSWTECSDAVTALHLAIQDEHVALVTKSLADVHAAHGTVVACTSGHPRWTVPLTFAYRSSDQADPAIAPSAPPWSTCRDGARPDASAARARRSPTSASRSIGWTTATRTCPAPSSP